MTKYVDDYVARFNLEELWQARGFASRAEAARACDVHPNVFGRLCKNEAAGIELATVLRICLGLKASPNDIFVIDARDDTNEKTPSTTP